MSQPTPTDGQLTIRPSVKSAGRGPTSKVTRGGRGSEPAVAVRRHPRRARCLRQVDLGGRPFPRRLRRLQRSSAGSGRRGRGRHRGQRGRVRGAGRHRGASGRPAAHHGDRHARSRPAAAYGVARPGPPARPGVCGRRLRHAGRGVPGAQPRPGQADPRRRAHLAATGLAGEPGRVGDRGVRRRTPAAAGAGRPRSAGHRDGGGAPAVRAADRTALRTPPGQLHLRRRHVRDQGSSPRDRRRRRGGRFRRDLRDGPLPPDPADRPGLGGLPGELHDAGLSGGVHRSGAARRARQRHHVPQRRAPRQDYIHIGRAERRSGGVRARAGVVRGGASGVRLGVSRPSGVATRFSRMRCGCCRCSGARAARRFAGAC